MTTKDDRALLEADWIHGGHPPMGQRAQVWMRNGSVRTVEADLTPMGVGLFFTDCAHPAQNVICERSAVKAWRLVRAAASMAKERE